MIVERHNDRLFSSAITFFAIVVTSSQAYGTDSGWFEVTRGMSETVRSERSVRRDGDLAWMPEPGASWRLISLRATGNESYAASIAQYNQLSIEEPIPLNKVLMIPSALLAPRHAPNARDSLPVRNISQIRETSSPASKELSARPIDSFFDANRQLANQRHKPDAASSSTLTETFFNSEKLSETYIPTDSELLEPYVNQAEQLKRSTSIETTNINMFAGQVKVFGKVDVTRVAVGNGDIIRAEVLQSGELLVIAEASGSTSLRLWHSDNSQSDFNIRISENDPEQRVRMENMVRMRVRMIEFRKSALGRLGIDWSDSTTGPGFAIAGDAIGNNFFRPATETFGGTLPNTVPPVQTYFGIASNITSRIDFLASTGDATTLAEPVLSTTSGGTASFLAGGEVPYPSIGANGQTIVQFKEYGIKLNVSPIIDPAGNVRTILETEISQLDPAVSVQGAPGLLTRKAQTQVNVRSGETIVISGLLSSDNSADVDKLPGIANLPIIGQLFRTRNARNTVSELVIFVTPEVIVPSGPLMTERQQAFLNASERRVNSAIKKIQLLD